MSSSKERSNKPLHTSLHPCFVVVQREPIEHFQMYADMPRETGLALSSQEYHCNDHQSVNQARHGVPELLQKKTRKCKRKNSIISPDANLSAHLSRATTLSTSACIA